MKINFLNKNPVNPDDLIQALKDGDERRMNQSIDQLYGSVTVKAKVQSLVKDANVTNVQATDIIQDAILILLKSIREDKFRGGCSVQTFLISICKNMVLSQKRYGTFKSGEKRLGRLELRDTFKDSDLANLSDVSEAIVLVDQHELAAQRDDQLKIVMQQLTEKCRERLAMQFFEGLNAQQIAEATGLANARQAINATYDCRQQLRRLIEADATLMHILSLFE
jgi:RNA polymerase sigma factor (sigma-70 family)